LLNWLKNRLQSHPPEAGAAGAMASDSSRPQPAKFGLEVLEPRVLLSGDSPFAEVYRSLLSDENEGQSGDANAYVQQLDAETSAEIAAAQGSDIDSTQAPNTVKVSWSDTWQTAGSDTSAASDWDESTVTDASVEAAQAGETALLQQASTSTGNPETGQADGNAVPADTGDQDVLSDVPGSELPRGPPPSEQVPAVVIAAASIQINDLGLSSSSENGEGEAFGVQFLLNSPVSEDGLARAPPVLDVLTHEALAPVMHEAIKLWTSAGISFELASRLAGIEVQITPLANGALGSAGGNVIVLDSTAAGRGWFVDLTPADNAEFSIVRSDA